MASAKTAPAGPVRTYAKHQNQHNIITDPIAPLHMRLSRSGHCLVPRPPPPPPHAPRVQRPEAKNKLVYRKWASNFGSLQWISVFHLGEIL